ncbi:hypothetical protein PI124_g23506 [Phytophthora idaei]|nr:hypothetical protein PI124_g23506 [Phytophthora idaei]
MRACYSVDETDVAEVLQMRDVLTPDDTEWSEQWIPWPDRIKENGMAFYVRLLWKFQDVIEKRMEKVPNEKAGASVLTVPGIYDLLESPYQDQRVDLSGIILADPTTRRRLPLGSS